MMRGTFLICLGLGCFPLVSAHEPTKPKHAVTPLEEKKRSQLPEDKTCCLKIRLIDESTGKTRPGCFRIKSSNQEEFLSSPEVLPRMLGLSRKDRRLGWLVSTGENQISVLRQQLTISAFSGIEFSVVEQKIDLRNRENATIDLRMPRIFSARQKGKWIAGNTHLHLRELTREMADRYLTEVSRADGLDMVFVSFLERAIVDRNYISNAYTTDDLKRISGKDLWFGSGEEYRHNFGGGGEGYGHVMFLDISRRILPASLGPGITKMGSDGTPLRVGIDQAKADHGTIVWCHNAFGLEDIPSWLSGRVDAQNIFDGGNQGSYEDSFYRYLNLGIRVPFSTGTDWFIYDLSRVYVRLPENTKMSPKTWLENLRAGRSVITNGPWLELTVDQSEPGDTISSRSAKTVSISARSMGRHDVEAIEIIKNGRVVLDGKEIKEASLRIEKSSWIAARIRPRAEVRNEFDKKIFAHTSPVYILIGDQAIFDETTCKETIAELKGSMESIKTNGKFANDTEHEAVLKIYSKAMEKHSSPR